MLGMLLTEGATPPVAVAGGPAAILAAVVFLERALVPPSS
jgi:hypothetical protein